MRFKIRLVVIATLLVGLAQYVGCDQQKRDWVTYRSSGFGFTLKHPKQWHPYETAFGDGVWSVSSFKVSDGREIHFGPGLAKENVTLESIRPLLKSGEQNGANDYHDPIVISEWKDIALGPNRGYTATVTRPNGDARTSFVLKVGERVYFIAIPKEFDNDTTRAVIASMRDKSK